MSFISENQHSQSNCVNMWLGSVSTNILLFVYHVPSIWTAVAVCLLSGSVQPFAGSWDFLTYLAAILSCWKHNPEATAWGQIMLNAVGGGDICGITGAVLSRRELILHQVSSIFLGSESRGKCSPDTRRKVCTVGPRGGLYGKRRLRSLPASRLQTKHQGFTNISEGFFF